MPTKLTFNGIISIPTKQVDGFMTEFNKFLQLHDATFKGRCNAMDFEDVEFVEYV